MADSSTILRLRPFQLADATTVAPWLRAPGLSLPPGSAASEWPARMLADTHIRAWVAAQDGRSVAFVRLDCGRDRIAEFTIVVAPPLRRQGIGRAVLQEVVAAARKLGIRMLQATVDPSNQVGLKFFMDNEFDDDGEAPGGRRRLLRRVHAGDGAPPLEIEV